jgi:glycosyltransferase involved in cell wall biosynthesis
MRLTEKTIAILIGGHFASAPRAQKEAAALAKAGARVLVRGTWSNPKFAEEDCQLAIALGVDFKPVVSVIGQSGRQVRLKQKLARILFSQFGIVTARAYGMAAPELLSEARKIEADLTMVHSEAGLWAAKKLLASGYRVGVDFEDWFSQDLPEADRKSRPVLQLQELERYVLKNAHCCFATTRIMAEALAKDAGCARVPIAIPNCFPANPNPGIEPDGQDEKQTDLVSFYWVSQTIGPGRGLETLAHALTLLKGKWQLALRGDLRGYRSWFDDVFPEQVREHVKLLHVVPNRELLNRAMSHDVGLALEIPYCPNKELTASNKIFEYLRAGLAVIATDTMGQQEVMSACPHAGQLVKSGNAESMATAMQLMIDNKPVLVNSKKASQLAGKDVWAWKHYEDVLVNTVAAALTEKP